MLVSEDQVRLDCMITIPVQVLVSQSDYEQWDAPDGDLEATQRVNLALANAADEMANEADDFLEVTEAWLVDENEDPVVRLKKFE